MKLLLILLFPVLLHAQSINIAPSSFHFWGTTPDMSEFAIAYHGVSVHAFIPYREREDYTDHWSRSNVAISYQPLRFRQIARLGAIVFYRRFPTDSGTRINAMLDLGYRFGRLGIYYQHISNGFGLFDSYNPGMDSIKLTLFLR